MLFHHAFVCIFALTASAISIQQAIQARGDGLTNAERFRRGLPPLSPRTFRRAGNRLLPARDNIYPRAVQSAAPFIQSVSGTLSFAPTIGTAFTTQRVLNTLSDDGTYYTDPSSNAASATFAFQYSGFVTNTGRPIYTVTNTPSGQIAPVYGNTVIAFTSGSGLNLGVFTAGEAAAGTLGPSTTLNNKYKELSQDTDSNAENLVFVLNTDNTITINLINASNEESNAAICAVQGVGGDGQTIYTPYATNALVGCASDTAITLTLSIV